MSYIIYYQVYDDTSPATVSAEMYAMLPSRKHYSYQYVLKVIMIMILYRG